MTDKADRIYNVNIKRLALLVLPTWLRRPLVGALIYAGVSPLGRLLQELRTYRDATSYRLRHNGQVCRLRGALNDMFDPKERRITISDGSAAGGPDSCLRLFARAEEKHELVPCRNGSRAMILNRRGFSGVSGYDFWVSIPAQLRGEIDETRLSAAVNTYKLVSKRWAINYN